MNLPLKSILRNNKLILKFFSCFISYTLWSIINQVFYVSITQKIPVVMYQTDETKRYTTIPEHITVTLQATRDTFKLIDITTLAMHVRQDALTHKKNILQVTPTSLLLPPDIHVVNSNPAFVTVEIT